MNPADRPERPKVAVPEALRPDGPGYVFEKFVDHTWDEDGVLWLLVRWCGCGREEGSWQHSGRLPIAAVYRYCRRHRLLPQDRDRAVAVEDENQVA